MRIRDEKSELDDYNLIRRMNGLGEVDKRPTYGMERGSFLKTLFAGGLALLGFKEKANPFVVEPKPNDFVEWEVDQLSPPDPSRYRGATSFTNKLSDRVRLENYQQKFRRDFAVKEDLKSVSTKEWKV